MIVFPLSWARTSRSSWAWAVSIEIWSTGRVGELGQEAVVARVAGDEERVAEADVQGGGALDALERALQRLDAELARLLGAGLHPRLVELDDVRAGGEQVEDLGAHDVGEGRRDRPRVAVVVVLGLHRHRERAGDRDLDLVVGVRAQELGVAHQDRAAAPHLADDARDGRGIAVAVQRRAGIVDVDAVEHGHDAVGVGLAPDLTVRDDVQPGAFLIADRGEGGRVLRFFEVLRVDLPEVARAYPGREARAQLLTIEQPFRLGVGPDEACQHRRDLSSTDYGFVVLSV